MTRLFFVGYDPDDQIVFEKEVKNHFVLDTEGGHVNFCLQNRYITIDTNTRMAISKVYLRVGDKFIPIDFNHSTMPIQVGKADELEISAGTFSIPL